MWVTISSVTPKRLRLIAQIIKREHNGHSWKALASELEEHASEIEDAEKPVVRLKEPGGTVFTDLERQAGKRS
jgi:hypothetical protein